MFGISGLRIRESFKQTYHHLKFYPTTDEF